MSSKRKRKYYAKVSQPLVEAVVNGLFAFEKKEQAIARLKDFKTTYHLSKDQPEQKGKQLEALRLWIADYDVSEDEIKKGYCGHYALVTIKKKKDGKFSLVATKELTDIKLHPHKKFPKKKHAGWSHPIMRAIKRGKKFDDAATAQHVLAQLHEEYPETSVPGTDKLNIIVYERQDDGSPPVIKYQMIVKEIDGGQFIIEPFKDPRKKGPPPMKQTESPTEVKGNFTAMVTAKRNSKRKKMPVRKPKPQDSQE